MSEQAYEKMYEKFDFKEGEKDKQMQKSCRRYTP